MNKSERILVYAIAQKLGVEINPADSPTLTVASFVSALSTGPMSTTALYRKFRAHKTYAKVLREATMSGAVVRTQTNKGKPGRPHYVFSLPVIV